MYVLNEVCEYEIYQVFILAGDSKHREIHLDHVFIIMS